MSYAAEITALETQVAEMQKKIAALERRIKQVEDKQLPTWVRDEMLSETPAHS